MTDFCVLLWSRSRNALRVSSVSSMLTANGNAYAENSIAIDWLPLGFGSRDSMQADARALCQLSQRAVQIVETEAA